MRALVRLLTCGSVDDGKSTLLGRILHDAGQVMDDQLVALAADSRRHGTTGEAPDLALLVDGLEAEREQGITIDVAHRRFSTRYRDFLALDAPGHEQYTRNMATAASTADVALILVDASKGLLPQTRRHAAICGLMRVRHVVLAVNKMDIVGYDAAAFEGIERAFRAFAESLGFRSIVAVPVSARIGDNVSAPSASLAWFAGPTLVQALEAIDVERADADAPFRFPVQLVLRPDASFRGIAGAVTSGAVRVGDSVTVAVSGAAAKVTRILGPDGDVEAAVAGEAATLVLAPEIDVARGDLLASPTARPELADQFAAQLVWMSETPLLAGRQYLMRLGTAWTPASVIRLKHTIGIDTLEHLAARDLHLNEIGVADIATLTPVPVDPFALSKATGAFILVDRATHETAAAGMILHPLRRATNVHWNRGAIDRHARAAQKGQKPLCLWFTGLSGSGKSTIANALERRLTAMGRHAMVLDGDNLRHGLNRDLGFTDADRVENIRRAGEVARLCSDAGLIVICAFISPFRSDRAMARALFPEGEFLEVFVDTPLDECIRRDPKGLYAKARAGEIPNFTGLGSAYEPPEAPEVRLTFDPRQQDTDAAVEAEVDRIVRAAGL